MQPAILNFSKDSKLLALRLKAHRLVTYERSQTVSPRLSCLLDVGFNPVILPIQVRVITGLFMP